MTQSKRKSAWDPRSRAALELNERALTWNDALLGPPLRTSDGLADDSPIGWQETPWYRSGWSRFGIYLIGVIVLGIGVVSGLQLLRPNSPLGNNTLTAIQLLVTICVYWVLARFVESRRPILEASSIRWRGLLWGMALGAGVCAASTLLLVVVGAREFVGSQAPSAGWVSAVWIIGVGAAISEEIVFRGVIHRLVESALGTWGAIAIGGLAFGLLHRTNPQATWWGAIAIALEAGIMFGAIYSLTRSLWLVIGIHFAWNVVQGPILGSEVSGSGYELSSLLLSQPSGPSWLSGGEFGIEASVVSVAAWLAVSAWVIRRLIIEGRIVQPFWVRHAQLAGNPVSINDEVLPKNDSLPRDDGDSEPPTPRVT